MTVDNVVDDVSYNEESLLVDGVLNDWMKLKTFSFASCDRENPGTLMVNGTDWNANDFCKNGGLLLACTASDQSNPWHNFVSNGETWFDFKTGLKACTEQTGFIPYGQSLGVTFISDLVGVGAKKIWAPSQSVSLIGSPSFGPSSDYESTYDY